MGAFLTDSLGKLSQVLVAIAIFSIVLLAIFGIAGRAKGKYQNRIVCATLRRVGRAYNGANSSMQAAGPGLYPTPPLGRSQAVRQRILIPPFGGSIPPAPAKTFLFTALYQALCSRCTSASSQSWNSLIGRRWLFDLGATRQ